MFHNAGAKGLDLRAATETPLDARHTLVHATWMLRLLDGTPKDDLNLRSTFLLRRDASNGWQIATSVYHYELGEVLATVAAKGPDDQRP